MADTINVGTVVENSSELISNNIPNELNKKYFPFLDGLRGIAILMVILSHVFIKTAYKESFDGNAGVEIFFVLSGFLITTLLLKEKAKNGNVSLRKFYIRRILRIVPVAYLYLTVVLLLNFFFKLHLTTLNFISAALYLKNYPVPGFWDWFTGHFWTLSVEEQFYLICPFFIVTNLNNYTRGVGLLVLFLGVLSYLSFSNVGILHSNHIVHLITAGIVAAFGKFVSIGIGSLISILIYKKIIRMDKVPNGYFLSFFVFVLAIMIHTSTSWLFIPHSGTLVYPILIGLVILVNLKGNNFLNVILSNKVLSTIGVFSYSVYIWQQLFTENQAWAGLFKYSDSPFFNIPLLCIVAYLSYTYFERYFLNLKQKYQG